MFPHNIETTMIFGSGSDTFSKVLNHWIKDGWIIHPTQPHRPYSGAGSAGWYMLLYKEKREKDSV